MFYFNKIRSLKGFSIPEQDSFVPLPWKDGKSIYIWLKVLALIYFEFHRPLRNIEM